MAAACSAAAGAWFLEAWPCLIWSISFLSKATKGSLSLAGAWAWILMSHLTSISAPIRLPVSSCARARLLRVVTLYWSSSSESVHSWMASSNLCWSKRMAPRFEWSWADSFRWPLHSCRAFS